MAKLTDEQKSLICEIIFNEWDANKTDLDEEQHDEYILLLQGLDDTHYYTIIEEFIEAPDNDDHFNEPANWKDLND